LERIYTPGKEASTARKLSTFKRAVSPILRFHSKKVKDVLELIIKGDQIIKIKIMFAFVKNYSTSFLPMADWWKWIGS